jgi:putative acetyltransferase
MSDEVLRPGIDIRPDPVTGPEMVALLEAHLREMIRITPPGSVHALDLEGLRRPEMTVWGAWDGAALLGCGALKEIAPDHGEIKSMHTGAAHRGRGVGQALLEHIVAEARRRGYTRLSLETGSTAAFAAAQGLYRRNGFAECGPFGSYRPDPHSLFLTRAL